MKRTKLFSRRRVSPRNPLCSSRRPRRRTRKQSVKVMEGKMKEAELAFGNSIIGRLFSLLQKKSYNLTEDEEECVMKFACEHRGFTDDVIVAFIEGMRIAQKSDLEEHIKVKVLPWPEPLADGNEVFFPIKQGTQLKQLMNSYCDRQFVDLNSITFLFDGRRLSGEQTPDELEMKNGDEINALLIFGRL